MDIYSQSDETKKPLERFFEGDPLICFSRLTDKSMITSLNHMQVNYLADGYRLYNYMENNILQIRKLSRYLNIEYLITEKVNRKTNYIFPAEKVEELPKKRCKKQCYLTGIGSAFQLDVQSDYGRQLLKGFPSWYYPRPWHILPIHMLLAKKDGSKASTVYFVVSLVRASGSLTIV